MPIAAITVNYNGAADTLECLESIEAQTGVVCMPLVVDNGSTDDSIDRIRAAYPHVCILANRHNLGFCGGCNVGIRHAIAAGFDAVFLVNNDTAMEPDCLRQLVACSASHAEAAVLTPAIYFYGDRERSWFTGSTLDLVNGRADHYVNDLRGKDCSEAIALPWVSGCAMLIPADALRKVGEFDERFFCYWEDVDWSLRARRLGYSLALCPAAILYHKVATTAMSVGLPLHYYNTRNRILCFANNSEGIERLRRVALLTRRSLGAARFLLKQPESEGGGRRAAIAALLGLTDFHLKRFGKCRYRSIQR